MNTVAKEILEKMPTKEKVGNPCTALMKMDPEFAVAVEEARQHWLNDANEVLTEILSEIRIRITSGTTTMKELVIALDTISNKWNLSMGKPTSFGVSANVKVDNTKLKDEELDKRLKELENHLNIGVSSAPPHHSLPQGEPVYVHPLGINPPLAEESDL